MVVIELDASFGVRNGRKPGGPIRAPEFELENALVGKVDAVPIGLNPLELVSEARGARAVCIEQRERDVRSVRGGVADRIVVGETQLLVKVVPMAPADAAVLSALVTIVMTQKFE